MKDTTCPEQYCENQHATTFRVFQELDYDGPADDSGTAPYEEVQISPSSVYTALKRDKQNDRDITDNSTYQKLIKPYSGHDDDQTDAYEEVHIIR